MTLMDVALDCVHRGWFVFPCVPRTKRPLGGLVPNGVLDASNDEAQVRAWWKAKPDANVAIACGPSGLSVVDCDHGNHSEADAREWIKRAGLPETYSVHTGRRTSKDGSPEYGVQLYYADTMPSVGEFALGGSTGQIKSLGGYVMAAGSIHPDSGEQYEMMTNAPVASLPSVVRALKTEHKPVEDDWQPITENRNIRLTSIAGKLRNAGLSPEALKVALLQVNADRCEPPLEDEEVERIAASVSRYALPQDMQITIGGKSAAPNSPLDWRAHYHSFEQMENTPPPVFLIEDFLLYESITALAAPVGQRKSLVALNVAHALCTGEALFGRFAVKTLPTRVLYLCPEMGIRSFADRVRKIGLMPYVSKTLFCRTMSMEGELGLAELMPEELDGAVVIIDTAVRYLEGDENSSEHMRAFAAQVFRLSKEGHAAAVLLLHHSAKGAKESSELTLENAMRGSGELGAFVTCCWATRLQDPEHPYESASFLANVKPRDFDARPFEVTGAPDCLLHFVGDGSAPAVLIKGQGGNRANRDGQDETARAIIKANLTKTVREIKAVLADAGIKRSDGWISMRRGDIKGTGSRLSS
jgi:hypothetical protein